MLLHSPIAITELITNNKELSRLSGRTSRKSKAAGGEKAIKDALKWVVKTLPRLRIKEYSKIATTQSVC